MDAINNPVLEIGHCTEYERVSRRRFLAGSVQSAAGLLFGNALVALPSWMPRVRLADPHVGPRGDTLVCIFLRGGADGLNIVVPHGEERYYRERPTIAIPRPDDRSESPRALDLDGFFGLHPSLAPLHAIYEAADLAFVQATGSQDETRSHFEAMDLMERGVEGSREYTGWLARHLGSLDTNNDSALRAISVGEMLPASLTGTVNATALRSIGDFHLSGNGRDENEIQSILNHLYAQNGDMLAAAAEQTMAAIDVLSKLDGAADPPARPGPDGADYGNRPFVRAMHTTAQLIGADVGVEVACIDLGGWDTHVGQGAGEGIQARLLAELAQGLAMFYEMIAARADDVTVVVMSEFGRRVKENGGLGTDHGHGNMMMLLGGGIAGGQVFSRWPGLESEQLEGPGDLAVTTDYRDILGELLRKRLNNPQMADVFPDYTVTEHGLAVPR